MAGMKADAFDDLWDNPFSYREEMKKARRDLEGRIARYAERNPAQGYRQIAEAFSISVGTLSAIVRERAPACARSRRGLVKDQP
jgi:hypothetical protein